MKTLRSYSQQLLNIPDSTVNYSYHVVHDISSTSVQFSFSVMCDSLRPHGLQHARLPCPSPAPRACPNSCPSTQWCHPTTSSSVVPSPPTFSLSQHHGLFQWVSSLHQVTKVLELHLLMKVKEESEKACLKLNIQKTKIKESGPITSRQIDEETMETVTGFIFLGSKIIADGNSVQFSSVQSFSHSVLSNSL